MGANRKTVVADKMSMHFMEVGEIQSRHAYVRGPRGPYTIQQITRVCGSWTRMVGLCRKLFPDRMSQVESAPEPVIEPVAKPVAEPVSEEPQVDIPEKTENPSVQTAKDALARLREAKDE